MEFILYFNIIISVLFFVCYFYQGLYVLVPFFKKDKPHKAERLHRYAVLICARNEETVIADLVNSIKDQDYPSHLITTFVMADNCTDNTARIARRAGAQVYVRHNTVLAGKGYAMDDLLKSIKRDWGEDAFDGYFVFDADNVLCEDYISNMNKTFCDGYQIVTGYRNSKNYGENWISAGYGLWFLRECEYLNHSRHLLGNSCAVGGTGFMFSNEIVKQQGDWPFHLLTEDIEFSIDNVIRDHKIGYCPTAQLYDEQPTTFSQSYKQRLRWAKGYYQVFGKYGKNLAVQTVKKRNFSCFDMSMSTMPAAILAILSFVVNFAAVLSGVLFDLDITLLCQSALWSIFNAYLMLFLAGGITTITQWKNIHTTPFKKVMYTFTFPIFMFTYIPIAFCALFSDVTWQPIAHTQSKSLAAIRRGR